jgi:hypothetical protein
MKTIHRAGLVGILAAIVTGPVTVWAQGDSTLNAVVQRLEQLERQNAELREQVGLLRQELDRFEQAGPAGIHSTAARLDALEEKVEVSAGRLSEQDQVKVEGAQRAPLRLTGMALFDVYANGRHGGVNDYPGIAQVNRGPINSGASVRGSVIGLAFDSPQAVLGGQFHGSLLLDLFGTGGSSLATAQLFLTPRLRTASVEGQWGTRSLLVGQDKVIFSPREPNALAAHLLSPLGAAGNLYGWRPQVRFEQKVGLGANQEVRAQIGAVETFEDWSQTIQPEFASTLELRRPALEGHFQFSHRFDDDRRFEIGSGFHRSTTHVANTSIPATVVSVDGFINPVRWLELTGFAFTGQNVGTMTGRSLSGFTILRPSPGEIKAIAVRQYGGWGQATFLVTPRLSFNVQIGLEDPNDDDVLANAIVRNAAYVANTYYRVAPNVIVGFEFSQVRTRYKAGQHPQNNHSDLYLAYLF